MKKIRLFSVLAILLVISLMATACSGSSSGGSAGISIGAKTVDMKDYITINYGKYSGNSDPEFDVDYFALNSVINTEKLDKFKVTLPESVQFEFEYITTYAHFFSFDFAEEYANVSNGDKVIINITLDSYLTDYGVTLEDFCKACGIKFKETALEYTVSGLEELPDMIDIFGDIAEYVEYYGANGYGSTGSVSIPDDYMRQVGDLYFVKADYYSNKVKVVLNNTKIAEILYSVPYAENLSAGDTVTVNASVSISGDTVKENGVVFLGSYSCFAESSVTVTVPDLGRYLLTTEDITPEIIAKIKEQLYDDYRVKSIEKIYLTTYQPGVENNNKLPAFFTLVSYGRRLTSPSAHYHVDIVSSIIVTAQGELVLDYDLGDFPRCNSIESAMENNFNFSKYVYTEIPMV